MGKKVYEKRRKQTFYFQNRKNSHFSMMCRNLDLGMGKNVKNGEKVYGKRGKKYSF